MVQLQLCRLSVHVGLLDGIPFNPSGRKQPVAEQDNTAEDQANDFHRGTRGFSGGNFGGIVTRVANQCGSTRDIAHLNRSSQFIEYWAITNGEENNYNKDVI